MPTPPAAISDSLLLRAALDACVARETRAWLVGGAVRDVLLGRPLHDYDIAVEHSAIATARDAAARLNAPMYVLDAERDTARVVTADALGSRVFLDFARLREPTLEGDLSKRDFTINAMAIELRTATSRAAVSREARPSGRLIDPFGGQSDLDARILRAVTDQSLLDDPIRMLRAVRQSATLSFAIEPETAGRIQESAGLIRTISAERVRDELAQIVAQPGAYDHVQLLERMGLLAEVLPELTATRGVTQSPPHHWDVFEHTLRLLDLLERLLSRAAGVESQTRLAQAIITAPESVWADIDRSIGPMQAVLREHCEKTLSDDRTVWLTLKWAAIFHDVGKPHTRSVEPQGRIRFFDHEGVGGGMAAERMRALRFSTDEIERVNTITHHHMRPHHLLDAASGATRRAVYRFFRDTGEAGIDVLLMSLADHLATHGPDLDPDRWPRRLELTRVMLDTYFHRHDDTVNPPPLITGHDVMTLLNLKSGPRVGEILEMVREAQAAGEVQTRTEALALIRRVSPESTQPR